MILVLVSVVVALVGVVSWELHEIGFAVWLLLSAAALGLPQLWIAVSAVARQIRGIDERARAVDELAARDRRPAA